MSYFLKFIRLVRKVGLRKAIYRSLVFISSKREDTKYSDFKQKHFKEINGGVLEIGVGFGQNFPYYGAVENLTLIEPDLVDPGELQKRIKDTRLENVELHEKLFEDVSLAPASLDSILATLVFCSVHNPSEFLDFVERALKPGGRFFFLEHIKSKNSLRALLQSAVNPLWYGISGGCQCARASDKLLLEDSRFKVISHDYFQTTDGLPWVKDHVIGVLEKKQI